MTSSAQDNNALTNFQPMPKRFMVWDTLHREWVVPYDHEEKNVPYVYDMHELMCRLSLTKIGVRSGQYVICQSTNLFDKDGKEIFEGSIVKWLDSKTGIGLGEGVVKVQDGMTFIGRPSYDLYPDWDEEKENLVLVGHILSNPELLEEKDD